MYNQILHDIFLALGFSNSDSENLVFGCPNLVGYYLTGEKVSAKKFITVGYLLNKLRTAYVTARKAVAMANKINKHTRNASRVNHRARTMGLLNRIRNELRKFEKMGDKLFDCVAYSGVIINLIK